MPKEKNNMAIVIDVEMKTKISFWQAFKLRLAGGEAIQKFIEEKVEKAQNAKTKK